MRYWSPSCIHVCNRAQEDTERLRTRWINKKKHEVQILVSMEGYFTRSTETWEVGHSPRCRTECQSRWGDDFISALGEDHFSKSCHTEKINPQATSLKETRVHKFCCSQNDFCAKAIVWEKAFFLTQHPLDAAENGSASLHLLHHTGKNISFHWSHCSWNLNFLCPAHTVG